MSSCDMCGKEEKIYTALIEGTELNVCKTCAKHGKIIKKPKVIRKKRAKAVEKKEQRSILAVRDDYPKVIRMKREKLGLKQEEFAKYLAEKESLIHKIESGSYKPSLEMARKMEKYLKISLVEQKKIKRDIKMDKSDSKSFTIGDMIKVK